MKSLKMVLALVVASNLVFGSAYAQSALRADEIKAAPQEYRLGDSDDLQKDQIMVEQHKVCDNVKMDQAVKHQKEIMNKHLLKYSI